MVFATHTGFVFFYLPPSHKELFALIENIQTKYPDVQMEIIQNMEYFKINPSPSNVLKELLNDN